MKNHIGKIPNWAKNYFEGQNVYFSIVGWAKLSLIKKQIYVTTSYHVNPRLVNTFNSRRSVRAKKEYRNIRVVAQPLNQGKEEDEEPQLKGDGQKKKKH